MASCTYCREPVDPRSHAVLQRVVGWERKALGQSRRSGSDIVLREAQQEFACLTCIDRLRLGLNIEQGSLL